MPGPTRANIWTKNEDMVIIEEATARGGREWIKVAEAVEEGTAAATSECEGGGGGGGGPDGREGHTGQQGRRRTAIACLKRFQRALNNDLVEGERWTVEEEAALLGALKVAASLNT